MAHTFTHLRYHVVFSTKNRSPFLDAELRDRLFPYLGGIVRELDGTALAIGGMPDHVHVLLSLPPTLALADVLRVVKTNASRWVHESWPERRAFAWQTGYGAFAVSRSNEAAVVHYIANQEEHHRRISFQEEFLALLKKHGISYDPRYLWE
jgi:REP element-mobilizing transposase RayT